jgi:hypothetical protein
MKSKTTSTTSPSPRAGLEEGDFYYTEQGFFIYTAQYHLKRGYCCGSCCLHCPYKNKKNISNCKGKV